MSPTVTPRSVGGLAGQHQAGAVGPRLPCSKVGAHRSLSRSMASSSTSMSSWPGVDSVPPNRSTGSTAPTESAAATAASSGPSSSDEAVEGGRHPVGVLAEQLGLVAVHRDGERVEQAEDDDERGDRGADAERGEQRPARRAQHVAERHATEGAHRPAQAAQQRREAAAGRARGSW